MPVFRWGDNWNPLRDLEREVETLLQSVNLTFQGPRFGNQYPAVNLYERETEYVLTAEIPGTKSEDLELTIAGGILTIKGTRSDTNDVPEEKFRRQERFRGRWQRSLSLPERVQDDRLSAEFNNGVLRIHLPKATQPQPKQIPVVDGA
ncbi:MAG: Hsp20/alpha crystallin family protein [Planctomycetaceae bacterium]